MSMNEPTFPDLLTEQAYQQYKATLTDERIEHGQTPESMAAAIAFLGAVSDYYLNKNDGDFIKIEPSDTWQR